MELRFILHKPKRSENIGAAARVLANTGAGTLWLVAPPALELETVAKVATHGARHIVDGMRVVETLDEALDGCVYSIGTTGREGEHAKRGALTPGEAARRLVDEVDGPAALLFGDEQNGLVNTQLRRVHELATIPTADKVSLNLSHAVLVFAWEVQKARGTQPLPARRPQPLADERLLGVLQGKARAAFVRAGLTAAEDADPVLDEVLHVLRRGRLTRREGELLIALFQKLERRAP